MILYTEEERKFLANYTKGLNRAIELKEILEKIKHTIIPYKTSALYIGVNVFSLPSSFWAYLIDTEYKISDVAILEVFGPNVQKIRTCQYYKNYEVIQGNVLDINKLFANESFDLIVWMDGPEHLTKDDSIIAIDSLAEITNVCLILESPWGFYKQLPYNGNEWEEHKQGTDIHFYNKNLSKHSFVQKRVIDSTCDRLLAYKIYDDFPERRLRCCQHNLGKNIIKIAVEDFKLEKNESIMKEIEDTIFNKTITIDEDIKNVIYNEGNLVEKIIENTENMDDKTKITNELENILYKKTNNIDKSEVPNKKKKRYKSISNQKTKTTKK